MELRGKVVEGLGAEKGASFLDCRLYTFSCCGRVHPPLKLEVTDLDLSTKKIPEKFYEGEPGNRYMKTTETGCVAFKHPSKFPDNPGCMLDAKNRPNACLTCVICCREEDRLFVFLSCPDAWRVIRRLLTGDPEVKDYIRNSARIYAQDVELRQRSSEQFKDLKYVLDIGSIEDWL